MVYHLRGLFYAEKKGIMFVNNCCSVQLIARQSGDMHFCFKSKCTPHMRGTIAV